MHFIDCPRQAVSWKQGVGRGVVWLTVLLGLGAMGCGDSADAQQVQPSPAVAPQPSPEPKSEPEKSPTGCATGECEPLPELPPATCTGQAGSFFRQQTVFDGEDRHFLLHVPASHDCNGKALPLLLDFHGTAGGEVPAEEAYGTEHLLKLADEKGFIVIRPRSRSRAFSGRQVFQWDINPGDLERNVRFARALLEDVQRRYNVDPTRRFVTGFSNGTNIAAQFLVDHPQTFSGFGIFAGGLWSPLPPLQLASAAPRIYATTGFRDYMLGTQDTLEAFLDKAQHPSSQRWFRASDTGHDLYEWHWDEAWAFLAEGTRPAPGAPTASWSVEQGPFGDEALLELAPTQDGAVVAVGSKGGIFRRAAGAWTRVSSLAPSTGQQRTALTGVCFLPGGKGMVVGSEGVVAVSGDHGKTWSALSRAPEFGAPQFGYAYLTGVGCAGNRFTAGGFWSAVTTTSADGTWAEASMPASWGGASQVAAVHGGSNGTWISVGYYNFLARSTDGIHFSPQEPPLGAEWINDVTHVAETSSWFAVGDRGTLLVSSNDGRSWSLRQVPGSGDLYAVAFSSPSTGMTVGAHGQAWLTTDGGSTWERIETGLNGLLGDVTWLDAKTALVVGEAGWAATLTVP